MILNPNSKNGYAAIRTLTTHHSGMNGSYNSNTKGAMNGYRTTQNGALCNGTSTSSNHNNHPNYVHSTDRIAIIGAGVAGIATAAALQSAGYNNFIVYEKQESMGGLWVQNYPNVAGTSEPFFFVRLMLLLFS
jgi:NADPH-dependent glutamate synthase beta subunit-like oxidoreductase